MPLPPGPRVPTGVLRHIEIWDDVECNGGTRIGFVNPRDCYRIEQYHELGAREEFRFSLDPAVAAWSDLAFKNVLRPVLDDGTLWEYRIVEVKGARTVSGSFVREVLALGIKHDLQYNTEMLTWPMVNGIQLLHHELINVKPDDVVDEIIAAAGFPTYITKGTIEDPTDGVALDNVNEWETPLSALEEVARVTGLDFILRRNGATDYKVDMLLEYNGAAEQPIVEYGKNQLAANVTRDITQMATRIYPKGEGRQGDAPTIADCLYSVGTILTPPTTGWRISHWSGGASDIPLMISEPDQLNGMYLEEPDGTLHEIVDSSGRTATYPDIIANITLGSAQDFDLDGPYRLRLNAAGDELVSLTSPAAIAAPPSGYGEIPMILERLDLPGVTNILPAPFEWSSWTASGGTRTEVSRPDSRIHYGDSIAKFEGDIGDLLLHDSFVMGSAVVTGVAYQFNEQYPWASFQVYLFVEAGQVEFYVKGYSSTVEQWRYPPLNEDETDYQYDSAGNPVRAATSAIGAWHHLTLEPQLWNFYELQEDATPTDQIILHIEALQDTSVVYVDAAQIVNRNVVGEKFVIGSNPSRLYDAAIRAFVSGVNEPKLTLSVDTLDLTRLDNVEWPYDAIDVGVTCVLRDSGLDFDVTRRVYSVRRDMLREALTQVEFVQP